MLLTCEVNIRSCIVGINSSHSIRVVMGTCLHEAASLAYSKLIRTGRVGIVCSRDFPCPTEEEQTVDKLIYHFGWLSGLQLPLILFYVLKRVEGQ